jgi:DNA-binding response OmpR family regulator
MISNKQLELYARGKSILIVDDDNITLTIIEKALSKYFQKVVKAVDGKDAWEKYKTSPKKFDLIISDVNMPNMNGIELSKKIKNDDQSNAIIMLSGISDVESFVELIDIGIDSFVMKPLVFDKLARKIINILENKAYQELMYELKKESIIKEYKLANDNSKVKENLYNKYDKIANSVVEVSCNTEQSVAPKCCAVGNVKSANDFFIGLEMSLSSEEHQKAQDTIKDIITKSRELDQYGYELMFFIENINLEEDYSKAEDLLNKLIDIFYDIYILIGYFDVLKPIADEFLEVHNFLKSYRKTETLTKQELECLSLDFVTNDIKRFIDSVFIMKNSSDIMAFKQTFKANLSQMELIIQTMEDFVL